MSTYDKISDKNIATEMSTSFLDYAMSVIVARALPDVRDGLKPVHRRILYAMNDIGNYADKPYKKSARIVGDVIGKYHPHGDTAVYEAMVRMAQEFSFREPLVDGHGNFGSLDGDGAAAMRYTEARMSKLSMELLKDIGKDTIDYRDNYDSTEREPVVLPASYPNLLVNGASGIAVGMATQIPTHNLGEVIDGTIALLDKPDITLPELMQYIKGPDFPLGANILGTAGIIKGYETGNGSIKVRSEYEVFEEKNGKSTIIVSEIPYQVNKATLIEKIADAVKDKRVEGITDLRDESDRDGIRIVIELGRNVSSEVVMNNLFKLTQLESAFSMNMLALVNGEPKVLGLKEILFYYVEHQKEVVVRRTKFELAKAEKRAHILEGLKIALDFIDEVIALIRASKAQDEALKGLMERFKLTEEQSKAILEMQLRRLTGLERDKIELELDDLLKFIADLKEILGSEYRISEIIKEMLIDIKTRYANPRRSRIHEGYFDSGVDYEELIAETNTIVTLTQSGYIKRISTDQYKTQNRGGKGTIGMKLNDEDIVTNMLFTSTHTDLLFFTNTGRVFKTRAHRVPEYSRTAKGLPLVNLIDLEKNETITKIESVKEYTEDSYLMFVTKEGLGKKTALKEYERIQKNGKRAISLNDGDELIQVMIVEQGQKIMFATDSGQVLLADESDFRPLSRVARGVKAIRFADDVTLVSSQVVSNDDLIISLTANGFGKATEETQFRVQSRGGKGVKGQALSDKTGPVVIALSMSKEKIEASDLLLITTQGQVIRIAASDVKVAGRATKGVTLMRLSGDDHVSTVEVLDKEEVISENGEENAKEDVVLEDVSTIEVD